MTERQHESIDRKSELKKIPTEQLLELKAIALERLNEAELTINYINDLLDERGAVS